MQPTPRPLPPGTRVKTLQEQEAERIANEEAYRRYEEDQRNRPQQPAAPAPVGGLPGGLPFPGSVPGAPSDGLLGGTMKAIGDFFTPDKKLGEMVPASENPLMAGPGVGIGGDARRRQIDAQVEEAMQAEAQREAMRQKRGR